jgi:hypothetical protein
MPACDVTTKNVKAMKAMSITDNNGGFYFIEFNIEDTKIKHHNPIFTVPIDIYPPPS